VILFPAIDLRKGRCVRLQQGRMDDETVFSEDPVAMARTWQARGARWLHLVNLDGAFSQASENLSVVRAIAEAVDLRIQLGGGMRDVEAAADGLALGVSRIILGTVAITASQVVADALERFGAERVVVGIDARNGRVATHGWTETSKTDAVDLAKKMAGLGVERVVYTDVSRDGMMTGPNVEATLELARNTGLKVIASGGVTTLDDLRRLCPLESDGVEGVIVGRALYEDAFSLEEALKIMEGRVEC
jgi:phosphoribosylformimino-5-aminoimidazole carboxamide ribotide isomerase